MRATDQYYDAYIGFSHPIDGTPANENIISHTYSCCK